MRIGGFWGMPAPMLLLAFPDVDELKALIASMQMTMNSNVIDDLRTEFYELSRVSDFTIVNVGIDESKAIFATRGNECRVVNGMLMNGNSIDGQDMEFKNELIRLLADMIIKGEQREKYVLLRNCDNSIEALRAEVNNWVSDKSFELCETKKVVRGLYKTLISDDGVRYTNKFVKDFGFSRELPEIIMLNDKKVEMTGTLRTVCEFYLSRLDVINDLISFTASSPMKEEMILDVSFFDLVRRKPESFQYMVLSKFETIKYKPSAALIKNVLESVSGAVDAYKRCIDKYVKTYSESETADVMEGSLYRGLRAKFSDEKRSFFDDLINNSKLNLSDYSIEAFRDLCLIYDSVCNLNVEFFNKSFGVSLQRSEWERVFKDACDFFVCGLNFKTLDLFKQSIPTITMLAADKVKKSDSFIQKVTTVIGNVESLLSTIRPIGDVL